MYISYIFLLSDIVLTFRQNNYETIKYHTFVIILYKVNKIGGNLSKNLVVTMQKHNEIYLL